MKITLIAIGKTDDKQLLSLIENYLKRLKHYCRFELEIINDLKNSKNISEKEQKEKEGLLILKKVEKSDFLVILDEKGKQYTSVNFSKYLQKHMNNSTKNLVFLIGGPYGFSQAIYDRAQQKIALSEMTFSHQMIRLFFIEQIYRAHTILRNEPYHHQ